ncbi:unnamed protein product [Callosobruchus maculatus]|nr:unnamed protein product [Callosobruchus maculatus]
MQQIRISLRGNAVVLMGKSTMMRKAIKGHLERNPALEELLPYIKGNVGFVFTRNDLVEIRDKLLENKVRAPARAGAIAPLPVVIPAQNTGLGPEKTSFFQALSIPTKISKSTIEIINDVHILKPGDKVGASEATLLNMLNISPFSYGLQVEQVYDSGTIFAPAILDIKPEDLREKFMAGVANLAAVCLAVGYPTAWLMVSRTCWLLLLLLKLNLKKLHLLFLGHKLMGLLTLLSICSPVDGFKYLGWILTAFIQAHVPHLQL